MRPYFTSTIQLLSFVGIILSCYALHVERRIKNSSKNDDYISLCDLESIGASCSSAFSMEEAHLLSHFSLVPKKHSFDVPNSLIGIIYYAFVLSTERFLWAANHSLINKLKAT